jgi:hypothetical protein
MNPNRRIVGVSEEELIGVITHLAFYAGWPKAMSAILFAKELLQKKNNIYQRIKLLLLQAHLAGSGKRQQNSWLPKEQSLCWQLVAKIV